MGFVSNPFLLFASHTDWSEAEPECGLAIHDFLKSSHVSGHTLVAVGHSVGTTAL